MKMKKKNEETPLPPEREPEPADEMVAELDLVRAVHRLRARSLLLPPRPAGHGSPGDAGVASLKGDLVQRLADVRARITGAGGDPDRTTIVAV